MEKRTQEWLSQAEYDMDTAEYMQQGGRYIYAVFMCHLAAEKALKGFYYEIRREFPPKSHNLVHLLNQIGVKPPEEFGRFAIKLSEASIPTRYPVDLAKAQKNYPEDVTQDILEKAKEFITWIKEQL